MKLNLNDINNNNNNNKRLKTTKNKRFTAQRRQNNKCAICQSELGHRFHIDHKKALHLGGSNNIENLQALCFVCHDLKSLKESIYSNQKRYNKCHYCNTNHDIFLKCFINDIKTFETHLEEMTRESKYFIKGTFSYNLINF